MLELNAGKCWSCLQEIREVKREISRVFKTLGEKHAS